jgi:cobalt-zinc-cadmium efflux system outer membrane protein
MGRRGRVPLMVLGTPLVLAASLAWAQATPGAGRPVATTLRQAFDAAWARQPEAQSLVARRDAAAARQDSAEGWLAEPPALEVSGRTDQFDRNQGGREFVAGIGMPLWLPGERGRLAALAQAEARAAQSRAAAAQLRVAGSVREAWWGWLRTHGEQTVARERLGHAQRLAVDVARRVRAGELARSDQHQADGAAADAEAALAEAEADLASATQRLRALTGLMPGADASRALEPLPPVLDEAALPQATHPAVAELIDRADAARRSADLAGVQTRANPELTLATTRERAAFGDAWAQTITVGMRIPFGSDSRNRARQGLARAEAIEAEGQLRAERERLASDADAARARVGSVRRQLAAADRRAQLARESRDFFDKSFRLGETDLPTRLRIETEAGDAERHAARARIELGATISALRQALGLLPEQGTEP